MFGWFKRKTPAAQGPDFSEIDSLGKAEVLYRQGQLEKWFLMPLGFGGQDDPLNTVYVPVGTAALKSSTDDNVIGPLAEAGKVSKYTAAPRYRGKSVIPIAILIVASGETEFRFEVNIWGEALAGESQA